MVCILTLLELYFPFVQHPDVLVHNMGMFLSKTWGCCHIKHPGVVMQNMGML